MTNLLQEVTSALDEFVSAGNKLSVNAAYSGTALHINTTTHLVCPNNDNLIIRFRREVGYGFHVKAEFNSETMKFELLTSKELLAKNLCQELAAYNSKTICNYLRRHYPTKNIKLTNIYKWYSSLNGAHIDVVPALYDDVNSIASFIRRNAENLTVNQTSPSQVIQILEIIKERHQK